MPSRCPPRRGHPPCERGCSHEPRSWTERGVGSVTDALTHGELRSLPAVVDLTTAARALGIGRTKAYELARRGDFPCRVIRIGKTYLVPTAGLFELLGLTPPDHPGAHDRQREEG